MSGAAELQVVKKWLIVVSINYVAQFGITFNCHKTVGKKNQSVSSTLSQYNYIGLCTYKVSNITSLYIGLYYHNQYCNLCIKKRLNVWEIQFIF